MAEEKKGTGAEENQQDGSQQQQPAAANEQQQPNADSKIARQLAALTGLVDTTEIVAKLGNPQQPAANETDNEEEEEEDNDKNNPEKKDDKTPEKKDGKGVKKETEPEKPVKTNKLGVQLPGTKKGPEVIIEKPEQILGIVNSKFGMDIKEVKDLPKFFDQTTQWRADSQKLKVTQTELEDLQQSIAALPQEFTEAITAFATGQDYTEPFKQKSKFNFGTPVEKQDLKTLVNTYFPGEFTDEDFTEETPSGKLKIAITASKDKFTVEKQKYDGKRAEIAENAQRSLQAFNTSVTGSVSQLKQDFPGVEADALKEVEAILSGGPQGVQNIFFNRDGTVKPIAAKMAFLAKFGEEVIQSMMEQAAHQAESKTNEDILTRGADTRKPLQKNAGANNTMTEDMKTRLAAIPSNKKTRTY